ncbi:hypothetical protein ACIRYZ_41855 [Kitasatospora sp. NPDC101155]|uniref:hypothetical protein n=1 Tax=Kitasatospora sp. NPDC101155 TaxID=3364097 RepID=UPI00381FF53C
MSSEKSPGTVAAAADERPADPGSPVEADPGEVEPLLDAASTPGARLAAVAYRESVHLHRDTAPEVRRLSGACAVATAVVDGCPVAVTGNGDTTVRVWDLAPAGRATAPDDRLVVGFGAEVVVLAR